MTATQLVRKQNRTKTKKNKKKKKIQKNDEVDKNPQNSLGVQSRPSENPFAANTPPPTTPTTSFIIMPARKKQVPSQQEEEPEPSPQLNQPGDHPAVFSFLFFVVFFSLFLIFEKNKKQKTKNKKQNKTKQNKTKQNNSQVEKDDVVIRKGTKTPKSIGIVTRIAWDSDSESDSEDEEEPLEGEQVEVGRVDGE